MNSQLQMQRSDLDNLPPLAPPPGCTLRTFRPGDEADWARIMNECIGEGWTAEKCLEKLVRRDGFSPDGCFFAEWESRPEASATAFRSPPQERDIGYVHMVGATALVRGKGFGRLVTLATLHWFAAHGFRQARLETDGWRLPAISLYLSLGFHPQHTEPNHEERWRTVFDQLKESRRTA